jgi:hypothetical protein
VAGFSLLLLSCGSETAPEVNDPPVVDAATLPTGVVGAAYAHPLEATGGDGTYVWAVVEGSLPPGLSLDASGMISGTPTAADTSRFTVEAASGDRQSAVAELSIVVFDALDVVTDSLRDAVVGTAYADTLEAAGGDGVHTWSLDGDALPAGLALDPSGAITGTPVAPGSTVITVRATTGDGQTATANLTLGVFTPLSVATASLPPGVSGFAYEYPLTALGGDGAYRWVVATGTLPDGLGLDSLGVLGGTPATEGSTTFTAEVTSGDGQTATVELTFAVWNDLAISTDTVPTGVAGVPYAATLTASGGDGPVTWSVTGGSLPDGLTLTAAGEIGGTPSTAGSSSFTVHAVTGDGQTDTVSLTLAVLEPLAIATDTLPTGVVGTAYAVTLAASGGDGAYTWSLTAGTPPEGLVLDPAGRIEGTPTEAASAILTLQVTTGDGQSATVDLQLDIWASVVISTATLPDAEVSVPYTQSLTATGGDGVFVWAIEAGALPDGIALDATGVVSGTATTAGGTTFTVRVTTGDGQTTTTALDLKAWRGATYVEGYAGANSVDRGETIDLLTSTDGSEHVMRVYRMGWYGGDGRQLLLTVDSVPGIEQAVPTPDPGTGLIEAGWTATYTLQTDPSWTSGAYIVELEAPGADLGRIFFVLRDDVAPADLLVQIPVTTYQAYNNWGGKSLYDYNSTGGRAYKVSFDRPYADESLVWSRAASTTGGFFNGDYNLILWLEREGYAATYVTSEDLERDASVLSGPQAFVSNFHDEYWSRGMRDNLVTAMDAGLHAAFLDANNLYWQIRWEDSSGGAPRRVMVAYKDADLDTEAPSAALETVRWRDAPVSEPENEILGIMYASDYAYGSSFPWVVQNSAHWIYAGTGLADDDEIAGLVGYEFDQVWANGLTPAGLTVLAASPVIDGLGNADVHNASVYTRASGAIVFAAGTNYWSWFLDNTYKPNPADGRVQQMTRNLLSQMLGGS